MDNKNESDNIQPLDQSTIEIIIPTCCREGWDSCAHIPKRDKKTKTNPGL
jgi:hypothetical protein